jgi:hypothetical protein
MSVILEAMKIYLNCFLTIICSISIVVYANGQKKQEFNFAKLYYAKKLTVIHREAKLVKDGSRDCIVLNEAVDEGLVWLNDVSFSEGIIDLDLKGQDVFQHSFLGIAFHGINDSTFDAIYFRPFQFKTDDTIRKKRGVQYVSLPENTWQILRAKSPGVYENSVQPAPDPNEWFHARIIVTQKELVVYANNDPTPCLKVNLLGERKNGKLALYTADRSGGSFANMSITKN